MGTAGDGSDKIRTLLSPEFRGEFVREALRTFALK
jgi:hypothetical protein